MLTNWQLKTGSDAGSKIVTLVTLDNILAKTLKAGLN
jgi:hypothetical protein